MKLTEFVPARHAGSFLLFARLLMASLFVFAGFEKVFNYSDASAFAAAAGIPFASTLMPAAIVLELACAAMLLSRRYCRLAAVILAVWTFVLNLGFHQFWNVHDGTWQLIVDSFFHSLVMVGGLMYVVIFGADELPGRAG
jgi:putative oxidoreductase